MLTEQQATDAAEALGNAVQDARTMMSRLTAALDQLREAVS